MMKVLVTLSNGKELSPSIMPDAEVSSWVSDCDKSGVWGKGYSVNIIDITQEMKDKKDAVIAKEKRMSELMSKAADGSMDSKEQLEAIKMLLGG